jgi:hypothetical protein
VETGKIVFEGIFKDMEDMEDMEEGSWVTTGREYSKEERWEMEGADFVYRIVAGEKNLGTW